MQTVTLVPQRKVCPSIPGTAKGIIMSQNGVISAEVYYEERSITVTFDETKTNAEALARAVGQEIGIALRSRNDMVHTHSPFMKIPTAMRTVGLVVMALFVGGALGAWVYGLKTAPIDSTNRYFYSVGDEGTGSFVMVYDAITRQETCGAYISSSPTVVFPSSEHRVADILMQYNCALFGEGIGTSPDNYSGYRYTFYPTNGGLYVAPSYMGPHAHMLARVTTAEGLDVQYDMFGGTEYVINHEDISSAGQALLSISDDGHYFVYSNSFPPREGANPRLFLYQRGEELLTEDFYPAIGDSPFVYFDAANEGFLIGEDVPNVGASSTEARTWRKFIYSFLFLHPTPSLQKLAEFADTEEPPGKGCMPGFSSAFGSIGVSGCIAPFTKDGNQLTLTVLDERRKEWNKEVPFVATSSSSDVPSQPGLPE